MKTVRSFSLALSLFTALATADAPASHPVKSVAPVYSMNGVDYIPNGDASSTLTRRPGKIAVSIDTNALAPATPYTVWAVVFNNPEYCQSTPCSLGDLPILPGHDPRVDVTIAFIAGGLSDIDGSARFNGYLAGRNGQLNGEVVAGNGTLRAKKAEVHMVVRGHGTPDASAVFEAIKTFNGGCTDVNPCEDQQFAVHLSGGQ